MVTTGQMTGFVMAVVLPILAGAIPYYLFWKKSSKIETGMMGAIGYGILGYFWEEIIYSFLGLVALTKLGGLLNATGGNAVIVAAIEALLSGIFVALGLYWGIYLTNTKQQSLYRSATVGIGFGVGYALLTYGFQLFYAIKINRGTFSGTEGAKAAILKTSVASLCLASYRNILMVMIFMGVALLAGKYYLEKKRLTAWLVPLLAYVFIRFTDVLMNTYFSQTVARVVVSVILTGLTVACIWMLKGWMRTGEIPLPKGRKI